jgi:hypothetical protein
MVMQVTTIAHLRREGKLKGFLQTKGKHKCRPGSASFIACEKDLVPRCGRYWAYLWIPIWPVDIDELFPRSNIRQRLSQLRSSTRSCREEPTVKFDGVSPSYRRGHPLASTPDRCVLTTEGFLGFRGRDGVGIGCGDGLEGWRTREGPGFRLVGRVCRGEVKVVECRG